MTNQARQKAFSDEKAFFSSETHIHPTALVGKHVQLDTNVKIGPYCVLTGNITIESGTRIYPHVAIGFPAQVLELKESLGNITIKKNCEIREFVTIHASKYETGHTIIGNNCYLMNYCHVSHDVILEDNVTLINSVSLGGHTYLEHNVMMMAHTATHQFCHVGKYSALAPFSAIRQDLPPFCLFDGKPGAFAGLNTIGLKRAGFTKENLQALKTVTKLFYQDKKLLNDIQVLAQQELWGSDPYVQQFLEFIDSSKRGVSRKSLHEKQKI